MVLQALPFKKLGKDPPTQLKPEECCGAAMPLAGEIAAKVKGGYLVYLQVSCGRPWVHVQDFIPFFLVKPLGEIPSVSPFLLGGVIKNHLPVKECITILKMGGNQRLPGCRDYH